MASRGKLKTLADVLNQLEGSDWDKDDSNGEFSSDEELDSDIDDPNAITQYRVTGCVSTYPPHPSPDSRFTLGGSS
jgi:hypothetical protein